MMNQPNSGRTGMKKLVNRYKGIFRVSENINYYSLEDFQQAERQFVKFALRVGYLNTAASPPRAASTSRLQP